MVVPGRVVLNIWPGAMLYHKKLSCVVEATVDRFA